MTEEMKLVVKKILAGHYGTENLLTDEEVEILDLGDLGLTEAAAEMRRVYKYCRSDWETFLSEWTSPYKYKKVS